MPTESSAVTNLLHQMQSRRIQTDPGDAWLFNAQPGASPVRPFDGLRAVVPPDRAPAPAAPVTAQRRAVMPVHRERVWPWITATLVAAILGVVGAARLWTWLNDDDRSTTPVAAPELAQDVPVAPVTARSPVAAAEEPLAPTVAPAFAIAVALVKPVDRVVVTRGDEVVTTRHKHKDKRGKRKRSKLERSTPARASQRAAAPAKPVSVEPARRTRAPDRPGRQAADSEDPL